MTPTEAVERATVDAKFYIESSFWIINKERKKVPFLFNPTQVRFYAQKTQDDLILKARKEGFSSVIEAIFLHSCIFGENENCVTMSSTWPDTVIHMDRIRYFLETMGGKQVKFQIDVDKMNQHEIFFPHSNSRYWIGTAGSTTFGRGRDITKLHLSEIAHYENQEVLTGVMEACVPGAWKVLETTAKGVGEAFHRLWKEAKDPDSDSPFTAHFFAWFEDPTNTMALPFNVQFRMTDEERRLKATYKLTDEQVYWYRNKRASMENKVMMLQEHPSNDQEAFLSSGRHAFDLKKIQEKKLRAVNPLHRCEVVDDGAKVRVRDNDEGRFRVWEMPRQDRRYIVIGDCSEGLVGGDYSVAQVIDRMSWKQVAVWRGHENPGDFGRIMVSIGQLYNNAVLIPENNNHGWGCIEAIKASGYPHLFKTSLVWKDEVEREGFPTNDRTRNQIITALRNANDDDTIYINDLVTLEEMETFTQNERTGKFEAQKGCHDDCVISLAIGAYCINFLGLDETYGAHVKRKIGSPIVVSSFTGTPRQMGGHRRRTGG